VFNSYEWWDNEAGIIFAFRLTKNTLCILRID